MQNLGSENIKGNASDIILGNLINVGDANVYIAPYLFISITGATNWKLDQVSLADYLKIVVVGLAEKEKGLEDWLEFAKSNQLMAGINPLTNPHKWFLGRKRWMTMTWQSDWELHLHFGFVSTPGEKYTHIDLAKDTKHWIGKLASKSSYWWRIFTSKPVVKGEAIIASYETGIEIVPRQSFLDSLKSKENISSAAALFIPCASYVFKNYQKSAPIQNVVNDSVLAIMVLLALTLFCAGIRHFFTLPRFSWMVSQLRD